MEFDDEAGAAGASFLKRYRVAIVVTGGCASPQYHCGCKLASSGGGSSRRDSITMVSLPPPPPPVMTPPPPPPQEEQKMENR